ncbi:hypothetical protein LguiA_001098 [Lonicera macranthoides]
MEFTVALLPTPVFPITKMFKEKFKSFLPSSSASIAALLADSRPNSGLEATPAARTSRYKIRPAIESSAEKPNLWTSLKNFTLICCIFSSRFFSSSLKICLDSPLLGPFGWGVGLKERTVEPKSTGRSREKSLEPSADEKITLPPLSPVLVAAFKRAANAAESYNSFSSFSS